MDTTELSSMYAQIVNGKVAKEDSRFVTDNESSALWDQISREVEQAKQDNPDVVFAIPSEMPEPDEPEPQTPAEPQTPPEDTPPPEDGATDAPSDAPPEAPAPAGSDTTEA